MTIPPEYLDDLPPAECTGFPVGPGVDMDDAVRDWMQKEAERLYNPDER